MLHKNVIEPSTSPWASGVVLCQKKDESIRFCVDYCKLKKVFTGDAYPLPRTDDTLNKLSGAKLFSATDMWTGYWQVEFEAKDRSKPARTFQFQVIGFGLWNAPVTFERWTETVQAGLQWEVCLKYLDDVIYFGKTFDEMLTNLGLIYERFSAANLKLKMF